MSWFSSAIALLKFQSPNQSRFALKGLVIWVALTQIGFINAISGVVVASNLRILFGLVVQILLGDILFRIFLPDSTVALTARLGAGFVIGIFPILFLGRGFAGVAIVGVATALALVCRYSMQRNQRAQTSTRLRNEFREDVVPLVLSVVLTNLVFLRINQSIAGLTVLASSLTLLVIPWRHLTQSLWFYSALTSLVFAIEASSLNQSQVFTRFRFFPDWTEEQMLAHSMAVTGSRANPFVLGDTFVYHFFGAFYWGTFEDLFNSDIFSFSGPTLLSCSVMATALLLANSSLVGKSLDSVRERLLLLLLLFGSWSFSDSFALDNLSRSQSLSVAIAAMVFYLVMQRHLGVWIVLIPVLLSAALITKVTTGFFSCAVLGVYVILNLKSHLWRHESLKLSSRDTLTQLSGLIISTIAVLTTFLYVFVIPQSIADHGKLEFYVTIPDVYAADREWVTWIQICLAYAPFLALLLFGRRIVRLGLRRDEDRLKTAVVIAAILTVLFWQVANSASSISGHSYAVGLAAVTSGLVFFDDLKQRWSRPFLVVAIPAVSLFAIAFAVLERRPTPDRLVTESVLVVTIVFLGLLLAIYRNVRSLTFALIAASLLLSFGNSLGQVIAHRTNGVPGFAARNNEYDLRFLELQEAIAFFSTLSDENIYAIERPLAGEYASYGGDTRIQQNVNLLGSAVRLQFWAEPHFSRVFFGDSNEITLRLLLQNVLVETPNAEVIDRARDRGITHVLLLSGGSRARWHEYISGLTKSGLPDSIPKVLYRDPIIEVIELGQKPELEDDIKS